MRLFQIDHDQVGQRPFAQHAQLPLGAAHRPGPVRRSQPQRLTGRKRAGIACRGFLEEGRRAQLLPHVQVVVRTGSVRGHRHRHPFAQHPRHGGHAARNLHVALRVVRNRDAARGEDRDVLVRHVDAVRSDRTGSQHPQPVEVADRRGAVTFAHDAHLVLRLGDVRHQQQPVAFGQLAAPHEVFGRNRIGGVRRDGDAHAVAAGGQPHGLPDPGQHLVDVAVEVVAPQHGTDAQPLDHADAAVLEIVHIDERRDAAQQHLDDAQLHAERHVVGRLARLEGPDEFVEPPHQRKVIGPAALQRHGRVAMGVHQPRHDQPPPAVDLPQAGMRRAELRRGRFVGRHQRDAVARDAHRSGEGVRPLRGGGHRQHRRIRKKRSHINVPFSFCSVSLSPSRSAPRRSSCPAR